MLAYVEHRVRGVVYFCKVIFINTAVTFLKILHITLQTFDSREIHRLVYLLFSNFFLL